MMLSVMVVGAGAAFSDQSKIKNTEAVDMCTALNIIGGYPDGTFKPEGNITRAEVTKMICVALNGGKEPNVGTNATPTFSDVRNNANSAWAEGYIESCYAQGIVSGVGGGKFAPAGNVTATQMAKMLLVALGYNADNEGFTGNAWATNVNVRASQKGLYEDLENIDVNAALTRDNAAQMIWNALNAYEVEYKTTLITDSKGQLTSQITVQDKLVQGTKGFVKITLLEDKYESYTYTGILTKVEWNDTDKEYKYTIGEDVKNDQDKVTDYAPTFQSASDFSDLFGMNVKVVYTIDNKTKDTKVYGIVPKDSKIIATGILDDLEYSDSNYIKIDGTKYKTDEDALGTTPLKAIPQNQYSTKNNVFHTTDDRTDAKAYKKGDLNTTELGKYSPTYTMRAIDNDNDNKVDLIVYLPVAAGKVTSVGTKQITVKYLDNSTQTFKFEDDNIYKDVAKDDHVLVTANTYTAYDENTVAKMDSISGKVTGTRDGKVQIDGKWYTDFSGESFRLDGTYTFYVAGSFVFYADQKGAASLTDVLYLDKISTSGITTQAKVYFYDGTTATIDIGDIYQADDDTKITGDALTTDNLRGLYTYSKNGNEYDLTKVGTYDSQENLLGYDEEDNVTGITKATDNVYGKLNGTYAFADDAVVFLRYMDGKTDDAAGTAKVKVISGAVAKNYNAAITDASGYALYDTVNGTNKVIVAYVNTANDLPNAKGENGNYGYVVDKPFQSKIDGDKVVGYTIWNGKSEVTVYEKASSIAANVQKGALITFDDLGDGMIDNVSVAKNGSNPLVTAAVKGIDGDTFTVYAQDSTANGNGTIDATKTYIITKDTTVLYVDSDEVEGAENGSLQTAAENTSNQGIANIKFVVDEADGDNAYKLDLLVIEINNEWK